MQQLFHHDKMNKFMDAFKSIFIISVLYFSCHNSGLEGKHTNSQAMDKIKNQIESPIIILPSLNSSLRARRLGKILTIRILNSSSKPVKLVKRLAVGYKDSDSREIYLNITPVNSYSIVGRRTQLYSRPPASKKDFVWVSPGDSIKTTVSIHDWYEYPDESLELQVVYDASESLKFDSDLLEGIYVSEKILFNTKH